MPQRRRDELLDVHPKAESAGGRPQCKIQDLFGLLGKSYSLDLLYLMLEDRARPRRFGEIQHELDLSPKTLTVRLRDFVDAGLLARKAYNEIPPRVDYQATPKARKLRPVFQGLSNWSQSNDLRPIEAAEDAE